MNNDCVEVDELTLEVADYKNDYSDVAAEKLFLEVLDQLGSLSIPAGPRPRWLATKLRTSAVATNYQEDSGANTSVSGIRLRIVSRIFLPHSHSIIFWLNLERNKLFILLLIRGVW